MGETDNNVCRCTTKMHQFDVRVLLLVALVAYYSKLVESGLPASLEKSRAHADEDITGEIYKRLYDLPSKVTFNNRMAKIGNVLRELGLRGNLQDNDRKYVSYLLQSLPEFQKQ